MQYVYDMSTDLPTTTMDGGPEWWFLPNADLETEDDDGAAAPATNTAPITKSAL